MFRFLLALTVLLTPALAHAKPMFTPLTDVYAKTESVVVARMLMADQPKTYDRKAVIRVDEVISGKVGLGKLEVGECGGRAGVPQKQPFVAFLDAQGGLCFIASPLEGGSVRTGILQMQGFYDFNAHLVSPSMASLPQIRAALAGKPHTFSFRGKLHAIDTKTGGLAPTRHEVTVRCFYELDVGCATSEVKGLEWVEGVPTPTVAFSAWDPWLDLTYNRGWPRPLAIQGRVAGWDPKRQEHELRFEVSMPDLLTAEHLEAYLGDPKVAYGVWHYALTFEDGAVWEMSDGHDYSGGMRLVTDAGKKYGYAGFSFNAEERELTFSGKAAPVIEFDPHAGGDALGGTYRRFHHAAAMGGVEFEVVSGPRKGQSGSLKLVRVDWKGPVKAP